MPLFFKVKKLLVRHFIETRWQTIMFVIALYIVSSWLLLWLCGENDLIAPQDFIYWILVTASTVGYGDLSPSTTAGKFVVAFYVIPFGLGLFGLAVGRLAAFVSTRWRKGVMGLKTLNLENHILVIGWNESRTLHLIRLLQREDTSNSEPSEIVLCVRAEIENPLPDEVNFVKVPSFSEHEEMQRACVEQAKSIIIDIQDDDVTMTTALYCNSQNPEAHTIAYFTEDRLGTLLKSHCPNIECMPSVGVEMMAKSAMDPGSSSLHQELLDVDTGMTQYSAYYSSQQPQGFKELFWRFKEEYDATLIGVKSPNSNTIDINPGLASAVSPGSTLYYIADERITDLKWS